jgi:hypothetical protein
MEFFLQIYAINALLIEVSQSLMVTGQSAIGFQRIGQPNEQVQKQVFFL